jgi:hypothetical protein
VLSAAHHCVTGRCRPTAAARRVNEKSEISAMTIGRIAVTGHVKLKVTTYQLSIRRSSIKRQSIFLKTKSENCDIYHAKSHPCLPSRISRQSLAYL